MNDLKNGIIDIDGFLLTPTTKVEELEEYFNIKSQSSKEYNFFEIKIPFNNTGINFTVDAIFDTGKLKEIILRPDISEIKAKYNLNTIDRNVWLEYYKELRVVLDKWLEEQLGEPTLKTERVTEYKFDKILLGTDSYIDERSRDFCVVGGTVDIYYR